MTETDVLKIVPSLVHDHALQHPQTVALVEDDICLTYAELAALIDKLAAALQASGLKVGDAIALADYNSIGYAVLFLAALRVGVVPALVAPSATPESIIEMATDSGAKIFFGGADVLKDVETGLKAVMPYKLLTLDALRAWAEETDASFTPVELNGEDVFNIIYSSGTTGKPKGIVHSNQMRSSHIDRAGVAFGYDETAVTLIATPLYSNTTLVSFIPAIALGGKVVIMRKFDAAKYLTLAEKHKVTHAMLVPVQYKRIMQLPEFDTFDLSSFRAKFSTSAPFAGALKKDILDRWPGALVEFYGMTEGGGTCVLVASEYPHKLNTVGKPIDGHDIRLIDEDGKVVKTGELGEVVGHSPAMMVGYHGQPEKTREAEWYDETGKRFIRTGDVGRFDEEGFLTLMDRKKDMIISGGFNIYPSDIEAIYFTHPDIADVSVIGVPSEDWGETPVAYIVPKAGMSPDKDTLKAWLAERVGKTQRVSDIVFTDELPRSGIGKVLKRDLRDEYLKGQ